MAKDISPEKLELRKRAMQLARNEGKYWRDIGKDERRVLLRQARKGGSDAAGAKPGPAKATDPARQAARAAARKDGRKWRELSREDRQKYVAQARRT